MAVTTRLRLPTYHNHDYRLRGIEMSSLLRDLVDKGMQLYLQLKMGRKGEEAHDAQATDDLLCTPSVCGRSLILFQSIIQSWELTWAFSISRFGRSKMKRK